MSSCCHSKQWDLSAPFGAVSLPLVNPSLPVLPTCRFSCATETQLDLNLIARGLGCLHEFHSSRVHHMSGIEPNTFSGLFHLILMGTPSLEMKRLIRRLSCLPRVIQLVSQRSVIWTGFCVQAHTPLYLLTAQGQYRAAEQQAAPHLYQVSVSNECGPFTRLLKASHSSVHRQELRRTGWAVRPLWTPGQPVTCTCPQVQTRTHTICSPSARTSNQPSISQNELVSDKQIHFFPCLFSFRGLYLLPTAYFAPCIKTNIKSF